jgi:hypothetical protein
MIALHDLMPREEPFRATLELFNQLLTDIVLYLSYGIAILCGLKFIIYILNGFASKSYMGSTAMDNSSFGR